MKKRADFLIGQRRQHEEQRADYSARVGEDVKKGMVAGWENKTARMIETRKNLDQIDRIQARHAQTLEDRRARLAQLLAAEQAQYEEAVTGLVETQDQRRERMAAKALELRNAREAKRMDIAKQQQDKAFQQSCDVLREAISRNNTLQVAADRQAQIELNQRRRQQQSEEDKFFDEMWETERMKKIVRAKEDMERVKTMNKMLRNNLDKQLEVYNAMKQEEADMKKEEDRIYKEQIQLQLNMDAQRERERRAERVTLGRRNKEFNVELRRQKELEAKREKDEDIKLLNELLQKIKEEEERDIELKKQSRREALDYMSALREQMAEEAENDAELERMLQEENEKQWAKREAQWKKEQLGRENLLREVFEERQLQLELQRHNLEAKKTNKQAERQKMLDEMEALMNIEKEKKDTQRQNAVDQRKELDKQIAFKDRQKESDRVAKFMERQAAEITEQQFRQKVQQQLDLVEMNKPKAYQHIKNTSTRPF